ncbi:hypothetical protein SAMN05216456_0866 [Devosia crocina]|uniref:Uncharacterized protein n=1 Tax=Devosia crocina TaxID=429728 RepID=A0A1I7N5H0_9HYPH|nr:hypothetical protein SAMN05216456_0866 [Devosia crocina]
MTGPKPNRKWGRGKGGGNAICRELWIREEEDPQLDVAIRGPREEEFGARLSDTTYMNSTGSVGNAETDMSAMHFCIAERGCTVSDATLLHEEGCAVFWEEGKKKGFARGESEALGGCGQSPLGGNAARCKGGGETSAL